GFGLAVSEALWKETPVVGSNVGGIPNQIIDEENGFLVNPHDYDEAAGKVLKLLTDDNLRKEMGKKGKERVKKNFLITREIEDWLNLWMNILE
ncbi:glycosyl transferase family 1, partial [candidate division MSBL1 archaeon SCGC-AAA259I09]